MPLSHRFAISVFVVVVGWSQVSSKHCVRIDGTCGSALIQVLVVLDILEGLVPQVRGAPHVLAQSPLVAELVASAEQGAVTLMSRQEVALASTPVIVLVVDKRRIIVGFASHGWGNHVVACRHAALTRPLLRLSHHLGARSLLRPCLFHLITLDPFVLISGSGSQILVTDLFLSVGFAGLLELVVATFRVVFVAITPLLQDARDRTLPLRSSISVPACRVTAVSA